MTVKKKESEWEMLLIKATKPIKRHHYSNTVTNQKTNYRKKQVDEKIGRNLDNKIPFKKGMLTVLVTRLKFF